MRRARNKHRKSIEPDPTNTTTDTKRNGGGHKLVNHARSLGRPAATADECDGGDGCDGGGRRPKHIDNKCGMCFTFSVRSAARRERARLLALVVAINLEPRVFAVKRAPGILRMQRACKTYARSHIARHTHQCYYIVYYGQCGYTFYMGLCTMQTGRSRVC